MKNKEIILGIIFLILLNIYISFETINPINKYFKYISEYDNYILKISKDDKMLTNEDYEYLKNKNDLTIYKEIKNDAIKMKELDDINVNIVEYSISELTPRIIIDSSLKDNEVKLSSVLYNYINEYGYYDNSVYKQIKDNKMEFNNKLYDIVIFELEIPDEIKEITFNDYLDSSSKKVDMFLETNYNYIYINNQSENDYVYFHTDEIEKVEEIYNTIISEGYKVGISDDVNAIKEIQSGLRIIVIGLILISLLFYVLQVNNEIIRSKKKRKTYLLKHNLNYTFVFGTILSIAFIGIINIYFNNMLSLINNVMNFNLYNIITIVLCYLILNYVFSLMMKRKRNS
ncbi:MAG: hypothetical protein J6A17_02795 [Bacilli bacterium]|nr:hypothetical protein [Bacilli bacterium]